MAFKTVTAKIGNMRKPQEFVVYPSQGDDFLRVQSDTCFAKIDPKTGAAVFANVPGGATSIHLTIKGKPIQVPMETVKEFQDAQAQKGDKIGSGVIIG